MKKYYYLCITIISIIFVTGISLVFAQSWAPPSEAPPGGNTTPPINESSLTQTKSGDLWVAHLSAEGDIHTNQSIVAPHITSTDANTRILTIHTESGQFQWREAGPWTVDANSDIDGYEIIVGLPGAVSTASCSLGKKVLGGGCGPVDGNHNDNNTGFGYPSSDGIYWCNNNSSNVIAYAICVNGF